LFVDLNGNGIIGDVSGEGVELFYELDPDVWIDSFFDVTYNVDIRNNTPNDILLMDFSQDTGPVAKLPEPATMVMLALGGLAILRRNRK